MYDITYNYMIIHDKWGPCRHSIAHLQVADGGTSSYMEGSCAHIEKAVAYSRQWVVLQLGGWARC